MTLATSYTNTLSNNRGGRIENIYSKTIESTRRWQITSNSIEIDIASSKRQGAATLLDITR